MKKFTVLFLKLFLIAALIGCTTELLNLWWDKNPLNSLRNFVDFLCVLFGVILYFGFALNRHLPKLILLPLQLYLFWGLLDFYPLAPLVGTHYQLYAAVGQLILGGLLFRYNRNQNHTNAQPTKNSFSGRNLLYFSLINIPIIPIALLLLGFSAASELIEEYTAGFVLLKPNGLYMVEKIYTRDGSQLRLAGMIHLGQQQYYADLAESFSEEPLLILAEGVTDETGRLKGTFSYGNIAKILGLTAQEKMPFKGEWIDLETFENSMSMENKTNHILHADVDLQTFHPHTIEVLNALGKYLLNSDSLTAGYQRFNQWARRNMTEDSNQIIIADLIDKRNAAVLSYLPKALNKYTAVAIPWGALHMPGIEAAVKKRGFTQQGLRERLSIDFLLFPYEQLWGYLTSTNEKSQK